jgi:hypothetical protein
LKRICQNLSARCNSGVADLKFVRADNALGKMRETVLRITSRIANRS